MAKLTLNDIANLQNETTAVGTINANSAAIEAAMEKTLSRDGTSPNTMGASLDMNNQRILNLPAPASPNEPVRKQELDAATGDFATLTTYVTAASASATAASGSASAASSSAAAALAAQLAAEAASSGTVPDNAITNAKMADAAVGTAELIGDAVTNAKLANMAQQKIKARKTLSTGDPEDCSITEVLDFAGPNDGDILVRSGGVWTKVAAVAVGKVLASQGTGTAPAYVGGETLLDSGTITSQSTLPLTLPAGYKSFRISLYDYGPATNLATLNWRVSTDGGATYVSTTSYSYLLHYSTTGSAGFPVESHNSSQTACLLGFSVDSGGQYLNAKELTLFPGSATSWPTMFFTTSEVTGGAYGFMNGTVSNNTLGRITNCQFFFGSGNIAKMSYALYGKG